MDWKSHYGPVEKLNFYKHGCFKQIHFSSVYIAFFSILTFVIFNKLSCEELHDEILVMGNLYTRFKDLVIFCGQQGRMLPGKLPLYNSFPLSVGESCDYYEILLGGLCCIIWIPWMKEPGGLQSMGSQRVGHDWATSLSLSYGKKSFADVIKVTHKLINGEISRWAWSNLGSP